MHNHERNHEPALTDREVTNEILDRFVHPGRGYWTTVAVLAVLFGAGIAGFVIRVSAGFPNTQAWGYYAATFGYLLTTVMAAPIIPIGLHFAKALWQRPLNRVTMLFAVPGILWALMFVPLLATLPPLEGRASIWFNAPISALRWVDSLAVFGLAAVALALLYVRGRPDWAILRDRVDLPRQRFARRLTGGWIGSARQWNVLQAGFSVLGGFYLLLYIYTTTLVTVDFDMSLIPGWRSPIYPTYHILTSAQAAVALTLVTMALLRTFGGYRKYFGLSQFWALGKLQFALTLLWFYFLWSEFIVVWYGRLPREQAILSTLNFGPYFLPFVLAFTFAFALPFLILLWNKVRKSIAGPPIAAASVLIGLFFDRIRLYVPAYSVAGVGGAAAGEVPATRMPDVPDVLIIVGALAGTALCYMLSMRLLPVVSIWEMRSFLMLRELRRFLRTVVEVVAKPT